MMIERIFPSGAWNVYGTARNGVWLSRTYYGYAKREAVRRWRDEARAMGSAK